MKFLFDLFPLIAFFAAFKLGGMYEAATHDFVQQYLSGFVSGGLIKADQAPWILATLVGIVATACQVSYLLVRGRKVDGMLWLSLFIFVVFGGASIYLHDDFFLKWKPTLIYWLSGLALLIAHVGFKKNLIRKTMEAQVQLPDAVWNQLLAAWRVTSYCMESSMARHSASVFLTLFVVIMTPQDEQLTSRWLAQSGGRAA